MRKKLVSVLLTAALGVMTLAGCSSSTTAPQAASSTADTQASTEASSADTAASESTTSEAAATTAADGEEIVIKLGASSAVTEPTGAAGQLFADLVNERLAGRVKVEYYPGEQLGAATEMIENMQVDLQQGAVFSFDNYSSLAKDLNIMSMAFAFESIDHVYAFLESDLAASTFQTLEDNGIHIVNYRFQKNPRAIFAKHPIHTVDDLAGVKFRVPNLDIFQKNFSTMGAVPTIVAWSDYTQAMMQGLVDAGECSYESIVALDLYKYAPYISLVDYAYPLESLALTTNVWNQLDDEEKAIIEECAQEAADSFTQNVKDAWEADMKTITDSGAEFVEFDKQTFIDKMAPLAAQLEEENYWATPGLYDSIQALDY